MKNGLEVKEAWWLCFIATETHPQHVGHFFGYFTDQQAFFSTDGMQQAVLHVFHVYL